MKSAAKIAFFGDTMLSRDIAFQWAKQEDPCRIFDGLDKFFSSDTSKVANFENPSTGGITIN